MDLRNKLIEKIEAQGFPFQGNSDYGSIGCNLPNCPGPQVFFNTLRAVNGHDSVQDVLVEVNEVFKEDSQTWPFSNRIYVLSSATIDQARSWLAPLEPDEISEGWANSLPSVAPSLKPGVKVYAAIMEMFRPRSG